MLHGGIILLAGLLCGWPMGSAINNDRGDAVVRSWRVAHAGLAMGGILLLALANLLPDLSSAQLAWWCASSFIVSGYGFVFALPLGAFAGQRGLTWAGGTVNRLVYFGNVTGAIFSLVGTLVLIWATLLTILT